MSALTVQVSRWSQAAANLLPPEQEVMGWVHSCYARIINVRTPGGRLLTLQGEGMLQAPLGLALATDVAALGTRLPVGALVVQDGPLGLSATNAAAYTALAPLWAGRQAFTVPTLLTLVKALVGLGEGLTPSGDDFLVGLLAVLHLHGFLPCSAASPVHAQFCQCIRLGTSQLSGEFLRCAFEGHFAEPLVMLVRALCTPATDAWPAHAATLATVGHSSGVDAMVGIALGGRLLA